MQITITYPESWAEIKYKDYMKYFNAVKPYEGSEKESQKSLEAGALYFSKVPAEYLYKLPEEKFNKIQDNLIKLLKEAKSHTLVNQFEMFGVKYGFVPNLDDISYGEYLDLTSYTSKNLWENIPIVLSILYRPIKYNLGKNYTIASYSGTNNETIEMFRETVSMDIVFGAISFFLSLYQDLLTGILLYSKEILEKMGDKKTLALLQDLEKSGLDIQHLPSLLITTLPSLTKSHS